MKPHPSQAQRRTSGGFTLLEILVATFAFAILLTAVYVVFTSGKRLRDNASTRVQEVRIHDRAIALLRRDLRSALVTGGHLAATLVGELRGPESAYPGYLKFTTASARLSDSEPGGDVQEVEYFISDRITPTNQAGGVFVRSAERNLLAQVRNPAALEPLLYDVAAFEVAFFDGQQWTETWEYTQAGDPLPEAVRVRIQPAGRDRRNQPPPPLEVLVPWPTQPITATSTNTSEASSPGQGGSDGSGAENQPGAPPPSPNPNQNR